MWASDRWASRLPHNRAQILYYVAENLDAVGLAENILRVSIERQRLLTVILRGVELRALEHDFAETKNAVGLTENIPLALIERQRLLKVFLCGVVVRACECDVAKAMNAVGLHLGAF